MGHSVDRAGHHAGRVRRYQFTVLLIAILIFAGSAVSPPSLMDDVDSAQAQIARSMLESGDWVTARLNGVVYLEKAPLKYWMIALSYIVFGVHDWAARIPIVLSAVALAWLTFQIGTWAFSPAAGYYAGLALASSAGLWLFTRILIPDVVLTLALTLALYAFLRGEEADRPGGWPFLFWSSLATGFLLKGLIAVVFPAAAILIYWLLTGRWRLWRALRPGLGIPLAIAVAAPWVALATLANPPYLDFTMRSAPGDYHGFFWFFFLNEHLFRFLNLRYPRDYNTVPVLAFWLLHLVWLFPWSAWLGAAFRKPAPLATRGARARLLLVCFTGFILVFFTFSTTQEYYSMPCYPALALLIGLGLTQSQALWPARVLALLTAAAAIVLGALWWLVRGAPAPGDISRALTLNPEVYTLSLGHLRDLTFPAFAYLRTPLLVSAIAFSLGAIGAWFWRGPRLALALASMMILFTQAARLALIAFDPYLGSRPLAEALKRSPAGEVVFDNQYYTFSSVFFYADVRRGWLLNGRVTNLEYGSHAPGAPEVFLDDARFAARWNSPVRHYLLIEERAFPRLEKRHAFHLVHASGGKFLFTNQPLLQ